MGFSDEELDRACASVGAVPQETLKFHVEIMDAQWLCGEGGIELSEIVWKVKKEIADDAVEKCGGSKAKAAKALGISPQTLWNIQQGHHK
jgi:DNA-binding NtrC family response regulator